MAPRPMTRALMPRSFSSVKSAMGLPVGRGPKSRFVRLHSFSLFGCVDHSPYLEDAA